MTRTTAPGEPTSSLPEGQQRSRQSEIRDAPPPTRTATSLSLRWATLGQSRERPDGSSGWSSTGVDATRRHSDQIRRTGNPEDFAPAMWFTGV